jgi:hypothetical protein
MPNKAYSRTTEIEHILRTNLNYSVGNNLYLGTVAAMSLFPRSINYISLGIQISKELASCTQSETK